MSERVDTRDVIATLPVTFARRRTVDAGAFAPGTPVMPSDPRAALRLGRRPSFSSISAYRKWAADAEMAGFPVGGMAMLLGLTEHELVVFTPHFMRSTRPKRRAGAILLSDIAQMSAVRSIVTARVIVLLNDASVVELETVRAGRARRFVARVLAQRDEPGDQ